MLQQRSTAVAAVVLWAAFCWRGASAQELPAATPSPSDAAVDALVLGLGNANYAAREKSQKALYELPMSALPRLRQLNAANTDPEVTLRLREVLSVLESIEATTTAPISVDFKDASYSEVGAALAKATGASIEGDNLTSLDRFTLSAKDRLFWEVIDQLCEQHSISLAERDALTLKPRTGDAGPRHRAVVRGVLFSAAEPKNDGIVNMRVAAGVAPRATTRLTMSIGVAVDPRLTVYQARLPVLVSAKDELGNEITPQADEERAAKENMDWTSRIWDRTIPLIGPQPMGKLLSMRGKVSFSVEMRGETAEIADPARHIDEITKLGNISVTLKQVLTAVEANPPPGGGLRAVGIKLEVSPGDRMGKAPESGPLVADGDFIRTPNFSTRMGLPMRGRSEGRVMAADGGDAVVMDGMYRFDSAAPSSPGLDSAPLAITVLDGDGNEILTRKITVNSPSTIILATRTSSKEPAKIKLRSGAVREVIVPFEFKDLPVR
jgi:hypothetical protein